MCECVLFVCLFVIVIVLSHCWILAVLKSREPWPCQAKALSVPTFYLADYVYPAAAEDPAAAELDAKSDDLGSVPGN